MNIRKVLFLMVLMLFTTSVSAQFEIGWNTKGEVVDYFKVLTDSMANSMTRTVTIPVQDYEKFTMYTGSSNNDSASYRFELYGGVAGKWQLLWADSTIGALHSTAGLIGTEDTSGAKSFTYDMTFNYVTWGSDTAAVVRNITPVEKPLFTELKWVRTNKSSGNGTGPPSNKTKADDYLLGYRHKE